MSRGSAEMADVIRRIASKNENVSFRVGTVKSMEGSFDVDGVGKIALSLDEYICVGDAVVVLTVKDKSIILGRV